ncbi:hypothetical protein [Ruegeria sp. MALMAid1280]|uniref:hypothetical protein n=1 Tax=Ruegeria sp. MALMAid1280 TaxID=3411634 RepID=UPI003BA2BAE9
MTKKETRGAKASYTDKQLETAVGALWTAGQVPDAKSVASYFTDVFGIESTPRPDSLQRKIGDMVGDLEKRKKTELLRNLPKSIGDQVKAAMAAEEEKYLLIAARAYDESRADAFAIVHSKDTEIIALSARIRNLEHSHDQKEGMLTSVQDDLDRARSKIDVLQDESREQEIRIRELLATVQAQEKALKVFEGLAKLAPAKAA